MTDATRDPMSTPEKIAAMKELVEIAARLPALDLHSMIDWPALRAEMDRLERRQIARFLGLQPACPCCCP